MKLRDAAYAACFLKPIAALVALGAGPGPFSVNAGGIYVLQPTLVACWLAICGVVCYPRGPLGATLGWLWLLTACAFANRPIRDAWHPEGIPWWLQVEWLVVLPVVSLWWPGKAIVKLIASGYRLKRQAGFWTALAVLSSAPIAASTWWPGSSQIQVALVYSACCAGSFASARLLRTTNARNRQSRSNSSPSDGARGRSTWLRWKCSHAVLR